VDRLIHRLAREVPQRDVDGADGANGGVAVALPRLLIEALAVERVLAHEERLQEMDERLPVQVRAAHRRAEERVSAQSPIGLDGKQAELARAGGAAHLAVGGRWDVAPLEQRQAHVGDLHGRVVHHVPARPASWVRIRAT